MTNNWVANLDMLAANGVIDYDGAAFLRGTPPRYVGNPAFRVQPQPPYPTTPQIRKPLEQDTYNPADKPLIDNPGWKKLLFALVAGGALVFGGIKLKNSGPVKWVGRQFNNVWNWIKKPFTKKT